MTIINSQSNAPNSNNGQTVCNCPISGIVYKLDNRDSLSFTARALSLPHPVFAISRPKLIDIYHDSIGLDSYSNLSDRELKLLFIAGLYQTGLVEFTSPCKFYQIDTSKILALLYPLLDILTFLDSRHRADNTLVSYVVSEQNSNTTLHSIATLVYTWQSNIDSYYIPVARVQAKTKLEQIEKNLRTILERTPKSQKTAFSLAKWADKVFSFPSTTIPLKNRIGDYDSMPLSDYWIYIITCCSTVDKDYKLWSIDNDDIQELYDFILDNIDLEIDSVLSSTLLKVIESGIKSKGFKIGVTNNHFTPDASLRPSQLPDKPVQTDFTSIVDYYKALALYKSEILKWQ